MLLRRLKRLGELTASAAVTVLAGITSHARRRFWRDDLGYADVPWRGVLGHRQVTDAYLAGLARRDRGPLVTFDAGLAALHVDVAMLLPELAEPA